jgi:hypothetical protein
VITGTYELRWIVRPGLRAELVLALLALASLALIPVHITTIYSGLPAHAQFLHVPVILIPVATIGALALAIRPRWIKRYGVALAAVAVAALAGTFLTVGAGLALRSALHLHPGSVGPAALITRHANAAMILRYLMIAFTAVAIAAVLAHRIASGRRTEWLWLDRSLARTGTLRILRAALAALAIACAYFVFHTGELGAKAVWQGRLPTPIGGAGAAPSGLGRGLPGTRGSGTP